MDVFRFYGTEKQAFSKKIIDPNLAAKSMNSEEKNKLTYCYWIEQIVEYIKELKAIKKKINTANKVELEKKKTKIKEDRDILMESIKEYAENFTKLNYKEYKMASLTAKYNDTECSWKFQTNNK